MVDNVIFIPIYWKYVQIPIKWNTDGFVSDAVKLGLMEEDYRQSVYRSQLSHVYPPLTPTALMSADIVYIRPEH